MNVRFTILILSTWLLYGCVSFEVAPSASLSCDPALAGHWRPRDAPPEVAPSIVSDTCVIIDADYRGQEQRRSFRTFELDGARYIAIEEDAPSVIVDEQGQQIEVWPKTRVALFRYKLEGDVAMVWEAKKIETVLAWAGDGVVVHTALARQYASTTPDAYLELGESVYLTGTQESLAAKLRTHGRALFSDLSEEAAIPLIRIDRDPKTTP